MKKNSIRAAALACCFFMLGCRQAPMQSQSSEYDVLTVATTDRTIPVDYSATIRGRQDIAIYAQVSGDNNWNAINYDFVNSPATGILIW